MKTLALVLCAFVIAGCTPIVDEQEVLAARNSGTQLPVNSQAAGVETGESVLPYEFVGVHSWLNLESDKTALTRKELVGKVVLVDFWTYSCINCIRTLPYLTSWDEKYRDAGLVIVGMHSPEFDFEKEENNVREALARHGIEYPVALDNDHKTWDNYQNRYWPHSYLFDRNGNLVYDHIGEGRYDEMERKIQELLAVDGNTTIVEVPEFTRISTPEIYLGGLTSRGNTNYDLTLGEHNFTLPQKEQRNEVQLGGEWIINEEYIVAGENAQLRLFYHAKAVHVVAGGVGTISGSLSSKDSTSVLAKSAVSGEQLYTLSSTDYIDQTITLNVSPGVSLYSFTFG